MFGRVMKWTAGGMVLLALLTLSAHCWRSEPEEPGLGIFHCFLPDEFPNRRKRRNVIKSSVIHPSKYGIFNMPYFDTLTLEEDGGHAIARG